MAKVCECGQRIEFVEIKGRVIPLDLSAPVYAVWRDGDGRKGNDVKGVRAEGSKKGSRIATNRPAYFVSHFKTCPLADQFSAKKSAKQQQAEAIFELIDEINGLELGLNWDSEAVASRVDQITALRREMTGSGPLL